MMISQCKCTLTIVGLGIIMMVAGMCGLASALTDEEANIPGYYAIETYPDNYDFTGIWKEPPQTLDQITGGKIKDGMVITKDNVESVKAELISLAGENVYDMVKRGMEVTVAPYKPWPVPKQFMVATNANRGNAVISEDGNLRDKDGGWWKGGFPFPDLQKDDPQAGMKAWYNQINTYDGDDFTHDWVLMQYISSAGSVERTVSMTWDRLFLTGREMLDPKPTYADEFKDITFKEMVYVQDPMDLRGFGNLTYRYNDQNKLDDAFAYIPAMRRVRRLTSGQRFDAFVGCDAAIGDFRTLDVPMGRWNWKLVEVKPKLTTLYACDYITENHNAMRLHPSTIGNKFPKMNWRIWPEVWVIEATPKTKQDCPVYSKKIVWSLGGCWKSGMGVAFDSQGRLWKTTQNYFYGYGDGKVLDKNAHYESDFYTYDHQIDHASPWHIDFAHRKFNVGFKPNRFSTKYLQRYGH